MNKIKVGSVWYNVYQGFQYEYHVKAVLDTQILVENQTTYHLELIEINEFLREHATNLNECKRIKYTAGITNKKLEIDTLRTEIKELKKALKELK